MRLGIRAIVDYVFKRIFGCDLDQRPLIGLLNAVLEPKEPIVAVHVLNPYGDLDLFR